MSLTRTDGDDAIAAQALALQVLGNGIRAALGQFLVVFGGTRAVRVTRTSTTSSRIL